MMNLVGIAARVSELQCMIVDEGSPKNDNRAGLSVHIASRGFDKDPIDCPHHPALDIMMERILCSRGEQWIRMISFN